MPPSDFARGRTRTQVSFANLGHPDLVISFSLPTAKMAFALAESHGVYVRTMAAIVTVTTVSLVVIYPVFLWICERLWPGVIQKAV